MGDEIAAAEQALERLFRLTVNRKVHTRQTAAVGSDVTRAGYAVLRCLDEAGELSLGNLARECSMDPAAAGRQVRALEEEGLVTRGPTGDDGRVIVVRLTDRGRDIYGRIVSIRTTHMSEVLALVVERGAGRIGPPGRPARRRPEVRAVPARNQLAGESPDMSMPEGIGAVDLMIGFPSANARSHYDVWPKFLRDNAMRVFKLGVSRDRSPHRLRRVCP